MSDLNDPRVFFAAERTLMARNRTGLTLMAFGFGLERSSLLPQVLGASPRSLGRDRPLWIGVPFILLARVVLVHSVVQYRRALRTLRPTEIPECYSIFGGVAMNLGVVLLGVASLIYPFSEL